MVLPAIDLMGRRYREFKTWLSTESRNPTRKRQEQALFQALYLELVDRGEHTQGISQGGFENRVMNDVMENNLNLDGTALRPVLAEIKRKFALLLDAHIRDSTSKIKHQERQKGDEGDERIR